MTAVNSITIYYFSGTGNARQVAAWISEFALKCGIESSRFNIAKTEINSLERNDPEKLIFIVSPIHGFNFPKITLDFIRNFPKGSNEIVLMNTRAGMKIGRFVTPGLTGVAFMLSSVLLKLKGYKIRAQIPFDMPSNWISIHPAIRKKSVDYIVRKNYDRVAKHCDIIFSGKKDFLAYRDIVQDLLISPVAGLYYIAGRFMLAKSYYASSECDNCGLCIKNCPVKAIKTLDKRPYWTFNCESCMKCMNSCPKKAIETPHGLFVMISFLSSFVVDFIMTYLLSIDFETGIIRFTIFSLIFFVLLMVLYRTQHFMLKFWLSEKIIAFSSLTHYKFWGRYNLNRNKSSDQESTAI